MNYTSQIMLHQPPRYIRDSDFAVNSPVQPLCEHVNGLSTVSNEILNRRAHVDCLSHCWVSQPMLRRDEDARKVGGNEATVI